MAKKLWFYGVSEYEDYRLVGPFATQELAQQARDAQARFSTGSFTDPSTNVFSIDLKGVRGTKAYIAALEKEYLDDR